MSALLHKLQQSGNLQQSPYREIPGWGPHIYPNANGLVQQFYGTEPYVSAGLYRVTLVVEYLGWVDLDLGCSTILLGQ